MSAMMHPDGGMPPMSMMGGGPSATAGARMMPPPPTQVMAPPPPPGSAGTQHAPPNVKSTLFKTEICRNYLQSGFCPFGSRCQFAHGANELRAAPRHPKYKTLKCKNFWTFGSCPYGTRCHFMHEEADAMGCMDGMLGDMPMSGGAPPERLHSTRTIMSASTLSTNAASVYSHTSGGMGADAPERMSVHMVHEGLNASGRSLLSGGGGSHRSLGGATGGGSSSSSAAYVQRSAGMYAPDMGAPLQRSQTSSSVLPGGMLMHDAHAHTGAPHSARQYATPPHMQHTHGSMHSYPGDALEGMQYTSGSGAAASERALGYAASHEAQDGSAATAHDTSATPAYFPLLLLTSHANQMQAQEDADAASAAEDEEAPAAGSRLMQFMSGRRRGRSVSRPRERSLTRNSLQHTGGAAPGGDNKTPRAASARRARVMRSTSVGVRVNAQGVPAPETAPGDVGAGTGLLTSPTAAWLPEAVQGAAAMPDWLLGSTNPVHTALAAATAAATAAAAASAAAAAPSATTPTDEAAAAVPTNTAADNAPRNEVARASGRAAALLELNASSTVLSQEVATADGALRAEGSAAGVRDAEASTLPAAVYDTSEDAADVEELLARVGGITLQRGDSAASAASWDVARPSDAALSPFDRMPTVLPAAPHASSHAAARTFNMGGATVLPAQAPADAPLRGGGGPGTPPPPLAAVMSLIHDMDDEERMQQRALPPAGDASMVPDFSWTFADHASIAAHEGGAQYAAASRRGPAPPGAPRPLSPSASFLQRADKLVGAALSKTTNAVRGMLGMSGGGGEQHAAPGGAPPGAHPSQWTGRVPPPVHSALAGYSMVQRRATVRDSVPGLSAFPPSHAHQARGMQYGAYPADSAPHVRAAMSEEADMYAYAGSAHGMLSAPLPSDADSERGGSAYANMLERKPGGSERRIMSEDAMASLVAQGAILDARALLSDVPEAAGPYRPAHEPRFVQRRVSYGRMPPPPQQQQQQHHGMPPPPPPLPPSGAPHAHSVGGSLPAHMQPAGGMPLAQRHSMSYFRSGTALPAPSRMAPGDMDHMGGAMQHAYHAAPPLPSSHPASAVAVPPHARHASARQTSGGGMPSAREAYPGVPQPPLPPPPSTTLPTGSRMVMMPAPHRMQAAPRYAPAGHGAMEAEGGGMHMYNPAYAVAHPHRGHAHPHHGGGGGGPMHARGGSSGYMPERGMPVHMSHSSY